VQPPPHRTLAEVSPPGPQPLPGEEHVAVEVVHGGLVPLRSERVEAVDVVDDIDDHRPPPVAAIVVPAAARQGSATCSPPDLRLPPM
jgi:hypothetical protein